MTADDWESVAEIYKQGIDGGNATFELEVPTWEEWDKVHLKTCRIVAEKDNEIVGWVALSAVSGRCAYAGVAEVSIYISNDHKGQQVGTKLLGRLIAESEKEKFWTLESGIFPENVPSIKIHEKLGFRQVGENIKLARLRRKLTMVQVCERAGVYHDLLFGRLRKENRASQWTSMLKCFLC